MPTFDRDDIPTLPGARSGGADPLAVFRQPDLPGWALVRHVMDPTEIADVDAAVAAAFRAVADRIGTGQRVCLAVGSRGIDRIDEVTAAMVRHVRARGADGLHRAGDGQPRRRDRRGPAGRARLARRSPRTASAAEIRSSMDDGPVRRGRAACRSSSIDMPLRRRTSIIPINRVKPHTDFTGPVESGLLKMIAIGLGKQKGADTFHGRGFDALRRADPRRRGATRSPTRNIPFGTRPRRERLRPPPPDRGGAGRRQFDRASGLLRERGRRRTSPASRSPTSTSW